MLCIYAATVLSGRQSRSFPCSRRRPEVRLASTWVFLQPKLNVSYVRNASNDSMTRPTHLLLATALIYLYTCLPPTASSPALLKPEGSYSPRQEENIKRLDELLNQFLNQLAISLGKNSTPLIEENVSHDAEEPLTGEALVPLPPRPSYAPPVRPGQADGSSEDDSHGHDTQPANGSVTKGRIVFPSD